MFRSREELKALLYNHSAVDSISKPTRLPTDPHHLVPHSLGHSDGQTCSALLRVTRNKNKIKSLRHVII